MRSIKEKLCYVAQDFAEETQICADSSNMDKVYALPDGSSVLLNAQRFKSTELMFQPKLFDKDMLGIHEITFHSIVKTSADFKNDMS